MPAAPHPPGQCPKLWLVNSGTRHLLLPRRDLIAEGDGSVHFAYRLERCTSSSNRHIAVIEYPSQHALIDINALNLVHVHLNSVALNEPVRIDDAAVRDHNLVRPADEPRAKRK